MRGWLAWVVAIVAGVLLVLVATAMVGNRDKTDETVTSGEWAHSVCGAVGVWRGEMEAIVEEIRTPNASSTAGGAEPQSETPQTRTGFMRKGLERGVQATETMVTGIDNAGVPETEQGQEAAKQLSDWANSGLDDLKTAQDSLDEEADSLEAAVTQLTGAADAIGSVLASGVQTFVDVARLDPQLATALESSSTCQELRSTERSV